MQRKKVTQQEAAGFLAELRRAGATSIRRSPAARDGLVEIRWEASLQQRKEDEADLRAWRPAMALSFAVALAIAVLVLVLAAW